jgi:hypothetical protein
MEETAKIRIKEELDVPERRLETAQEFTEKRL